MKSHRVHLAHQYMRCVIAQSEAQMFVAFSFAGLLGALCYIAMATPSPSLHLLVAFAWILGGVTAVSAVRYVTTTIKCRQIRALL